jgi:hypothetical protein
MKTKNLTYELERNNFEDAVATKDFAALLHVGRLLNALRTVAESCRDAYTEIEAGYRWAEAAAFLGRLNDRMLRSMQNILKEYGDEPFCEHFREMFSGSVRDLSQLGSRRLRPAEFRLISYDPGVSKSLRQMDIFGLDILFPRDPVEQAAASHHEGVTHYELGRHSAIRPGDRIELQHLIRHMTVIDDFAVGAEIFLKALAKKLGFKAACIERESPAVRAKAPKLYENN